MTNFNYTFTISAKDREDAEEKLRALATLAKKLSTRELIKLAHVVEHEPHKAALAKVYLGV